MLLSSRFLAAAPRRSWRVWGLLSLVVLGGVACGSSQEDGLFGDGGVGSQSGSITGSAGATGGGGGTAGGAQCASAPSYATMTIWAKCTTCHSSTKTNIIQRQGATAGIDFDTYEGAVANAQAALTAVDAGKMPPARAGVTVTADEKAALAEWVACATPP